VVRGGGITTYGHPVRCLKDWVEKPMTLTIFGLLVCFIN